MVISNARIKSILPKIVNAFLTNFGSVVFDFIFSPTLDQAIMASIPPEVVIVDIIIIPRIPPPKSLKNLDINMNTMAHSLPFTYCINTPVLNPNLGIVSYRDHQSFIMADIPGIIEGASEGKGLGLRFLRHIERNSTLLFMVPADSADIAKEYEILLGELQKYNPELLDKDRILAISKSDMLDEELIAEMKEELPTDLPSLFISSVAQQGITELKDLIWKKLNE